MQTDTLAEHFREQLGERVLDTRVTYGQLTVTVAPHSFPEVVRFCKDVLEMTFFDFLSAIDEREEGFSAIARVYSHVTRQDVILKTLIPGGREAPRLPTITGVYAGANWHEREAYDMFGIVFEGHPGLLPRILTVENFEGWPLRKEFRLTSRDVKPWPGAKEPGGSDEEEGGAATPAASTPAPGADPGDRAGAAKAKAERAKAKAAEARKRKAAEKAAAEGTTGPEATAGGSGGNPQEGTSAEGGQPVAASHPESDAATDGVGSGDAEPGSAREAMAAAAGESVPAGTPDPTEPEGAADVAGTAEAKDAAAGARDGDTETPAPGDPVEGDQPVDDRAGEASKGEGSTGTFAEPQDPAVREQEADDE